MSQTCPDIQAFGTLAAQSQANLIPMYRQLMGDLLTPVLAYRRLVAPDARDAPSFLLESVVGGERVGRFSLMGAQPSARLIARRSQVTYTDARDASQSKTYTCDDPLADLAKRSSGFKLARLPELPDFTGGWVGFAGYDTVRYLEGQKLPSPPEDDRDLPDIEMGLYRQVVAFDHVRKIIWVITHVSPDEHNSLEQAYQAGEAELDALVSRLQTPVHVKAGQPELPMGQLDLTSPTPPLPVSNLGEGGYQKAVQIAKQYIAAGDIFQVVPSQRFELLTDSDPFDIYRALRVVNPSPYMFYIQIQGAMLVGSSPEILCRVQDGVITSRPLAGTRRRGKDEAEDSQLEQELLADPKDRAEHIMLVDLGRNDVGRVASPGSVQLPELMAIERYSHVMHISSTVTGQLAKGMTCWDALRYTLPVGTVSGAPKVRAMQIIDQLEATRRGPYGGAVGYVDFGHNMDVAIALRTMVVTAHEASKTKAESGESGVAGVSGAFGVSGGWRVHIQAGGGIVADSDPDLEHQETVNKAAALAKAVHLAKETFGGA